ncbi:MAG: zf-HC2 domain-containing protein [Acidobacteria bacterium]|nr:zf-HC2 domain-containing protein [Acidobacteriota bacterium]
MDPQRHDALECREIFELLSEYLDEHLSPEECERVRRHIDDCGPCVDFLESLRRSVALCHECGPVEKPSPLPAGVRERLLEVYRRATRQQ